MSDDVERLNRVLDDLAAERDPRDRAALTPEDAELAEVAALLKGANPAHGRPGDLFVERLGAARRGAAGTGARAGADGTRRAGSRPLAAPVARAYRRHGRRSGCWGRGRRRRGL